MRQFSPTWKRSIFAGALFAVLAIAWHSMPDLGPRVHDPSSIIRCGDEYWFFTTGAGIPSWHSKDLLCAKHL